MSDLLHISSSPHVRSKVSTSGIMGTVLLALLPAALFGIYNFGPHALLLIITTNCAVLGVAVINVQKEYNVLQSTVNGFATAVGFTISIVLMAGLREKMEYNDIPKYFQGFPMVLLTAGLMAIAFFGFSGII